MSNDYLNFNVAFLGWFLRSSAYSLSYSIEAHASQAHVEFLLLKGLIIC